MSGELMNQNHRDCFKSILNEIYQTIHLLHYSINIETKNTLLQRLEEQLSRLSITLKESEPDSAATTVQGETKLFTKSELSKYDGKNGYPAYVAVGGIVYNVTNNAAWAAASHFGLSAGKDLTGAYASCHANQDTLSQLKAVGRLNDGVTQL